MSQRVKDQNGFILVKNNPLSKVGVFDYLGKSIDPNAEPDKIYQVYRPAEELSSDACLESFKLMPFIDDHTMLGPKEDGFTPAEDKGIDGVIGEDVRFVGDTLSANIKIYSTRIAKKIADGKKQLSCGYRCSYDATPGEYQGKKFQYVQRNIRANHLALVKAGRMGPSVAVLDHQPEDKSIITLDSKELQMAIDQAKTKDKVALDEEQMKTLTTNVAATVLAAIDAKEKEKADKIAADAAAAEEAAAAAKKKKDEEDMEAGDSKKAMDAVLKTVAAQDEKIKALETNAVKTVMSGLKARDDLSRKLSPHVGTFDASEMTLDDVAKYGVEKLGLKCEDGQEVALLTGFLHNRPVALKTVRAATDASEVSAIRKHINDKK